MALISDNHSFNILLEIKQNQLEKDRNDDLLLKEKVDFICTKLELVRGPVDPEGQLPLQILVELVANPV